MCPFYWRLLLAPSTGPFYWPLLLTPSTYPFYLLYRVLYVFVRGAELLRVEAAEEGSGRKVASWKAPRRAAEEDSVAVPPTEATELVRLRVRFRV